MSPITKEIMDMVDMLPKEERLLAYELIKRLILAWDNDFTKLTPQERKRLDKSIYDFQNDDTVCHNDIDWN